LLYNLRYCTLTQVIPSKHVPGELSVVALFEIQKDTEPFKICNMDENPEMVDIPESELNNLIPHVRDHVKKFVVPHVKNDNEKIYSIPVTDVNGSNIKFYVNTTNDKNQSNCKYTPGDMIIRTKRVIEVGEELNESNCEFIPGFMTIKTTRLIKEGEELMLFYEMPDIDV
jgi:hypothetical protein